MMVINLSEKFERKWILLLRNWSFYNAGELFWLNQWLCQALKKVSLLNSKTHVSIYSSSFSFNRFKSYTPLKCLLHSALLFIIMQIEYYDIFCLMVYCYDEES